jgi:hypothetical protein
MGASTFTLDAALGGVRMNNTGFVDVRNGTLNLNGPISQMSATTLSAGTWQVYPTGTLGFGTSIVRTVGANATINLVGGGASFAALSTLTTNNGTLNFSLGGIFDTTPFAGTFTNNGVIDLTHDRWFRVNGNFVQGASGVINLDLFSTARYSRVIVTGAATLAGTAAFQAVNGFSPAAGTVFNFFQSASRTGQFATVTLNPTLPNRAGQVSYLGTGAQLTIVAV